jgi:hypothetical protein
MFVFVAYSADTNESLSLGSIEKTTEKGKTYPFEVANDWLYAGALQMSDLFSIQNLSAGFKHWNRFFKDQYNMDHSYRVKLFKAPEDKVKGGSSKEGRLLRYEVRLSSDPVVGGLSFFTTLDFLREKWGSAKGINLQHRYGIFGAQYTFNLFEKMPYLKLSYIPIYEFLNYTMVDSNDKKIDDKSREFLHHAFSVEVGTVISHRFSTSHSLSFHFVKDIKFGGYSTAANEISSNHHLFYTLNEDFLLYYQIEYLKRTLRQSLIGFKSSQMDQSLNLVYKF